MLCLLLGSSLSLRLLNKLLALQVDVAVEQRPQFRIFLERLVALRFGQLRETCSDLENVSVRVWWLLGLLWGLLLLLLLLWRLRLLLLLLRWGRLRLNSLLRLRNLLLLLLWLLLLLLLELRLLLLLRLHLLRQLLLLHLRRTCIWRPRRAKVVLVILLGGVGQGSCSGELLHLLRCELHARVLCLLLGLE